MTTPRSDSKTAVKEAGAPALTTAVIVASGPMFEAGPPAIRFSDDPRPVTPLTEVAGLALFQRTVLTLQRAGITRLLILADQHEAALRRCLSQDSRITALVRWIPVREFPPNDVKTWEALAGDIQGMCLVAGTHAVFSRGLVEHLRHEAQGKDSVLAVTSPSNGVAGSQDLAELLVLPVNLLGGSAGSLTAAKADEPPLRSIMRQASARGRLRTIAAVSDHTHWYRSVRYEADVREAERILLHSLQSDLDGFVDTYFNRKLSRVLTRLFLFLRWPPNAITILSILIGLSAALFLSFGTYVAGVIGALLFQVSAIVDCCDGDVARLTFTESRFGAQLDLLGDNAVHMVMFAAIGWAGYADTQSFAPLGLGAAAIAGSALSLWFVTRLKARPTQTESNHPGQQSRADLLVHNLANRDFSVVVLLFSLLNGLGVFLWLAAIGSNLFWLYAAWAGRPRAG
ncbi:MAG: CDP-alcohol phosphatidyltransferase family protein [Nitrospiraceae bacterium]